jgi:hypothetical protein
LQGSRGSEKANKLIKDSDAKFYLKISGMKSPQYIAIVICVLMAVSPVSCTWRPQFGCFGGTCKKLPEAEPSDTGEAFRTTHDPQSDFEPKDPQGTGTATNPANIKDLYESAWDPISKAMPNMLADQYPKFAVLSKMHLSNKFDARTLNFPSDADDAWIKRSAARYQGNVTVIFGNASQSVPIMQHFLNLRGLTYNGTDRATHLDISTPNTSRLHSIAIISTYLETVSGLDSHSMLQNLTIEGNFGFSSHTEADTGNLYLSTGV